MANFIFSAFADEYSSNFDEQLVALKKEGLTHIELRNLDGKSVINLSLDEAREYKKKLDTYGIKVSSIGSPIGKSDITDDPSFEIERVKHACELAKIFETKNIRMFSYYNHHNVDFDKYEREVFKRLDSLLEIAEKEGTTLCHENESGIYGDIIDRCVKLYRHFNGRLRCVYDMANYVINHQDALKAYLSTKEYIEYFHVKDAYSIGAVVPPGKGEGNIREVMSLANKDFNRNVLVTVEPHLWQFGGLKTIAGASFENPYVFDSQQDAFIAGVRNTKKQIDISKNLDVFFKDNLLVKVSPNRDLMGMDASKDIELRIKLLLLEKEFVNIVFAAAPSQNDVLYHLVKNSPEIEWNRINAFHMDEYVGLDSNAPQKFANYLNEHIFSLVNFRSVNYIDCSSNIDEEIKRYTKLLEEYPPDIVIMGIGENGHIAFNDPGYADFSDKKPIKVVKLDDICRNQQVHDGAFKNIKEVPTHAVTLTIPTLFNAKYLFSIVPTSNKASAVFETLNGAIDEHCPASILRRHTWARTSSR